MTDVINLRRARKDRARAEAGRQAERNRAAHGRTRAEKALAGAEAARQRSDLDGAKREEE